MKNIVGGLGVKEQGTAVRDISKEVEEAVMKTLREICENCNYFSLNKVDNKQMTIFTRSLR